MKSRHGRESWCTLGVITALLTGCAVDAERPAAGRVLAGPIGIRTVGDQELTCTGKAERCLVPVYVERLDEADGWCRPHIDFARIWVKPAQGNLGNKKVKIVWVLEPLDADDTTKYRFRDGDGIQLRGNTAGEFEALNTESDTRFKVRSVHSAASGPTFDYDINLQRKKGLLSGWVDCVGADPKITNTN